MATIQENLQIIADSTSAIKQAIIDKGGDASGDITTWADAIGGISNGGGSSEEEITFTGTLVWNMMDCTITGSLSSVPKDMYGGSLVMVFRNHIADVVMNKVNISTNIKDLSITCDYGEPTTGNEIPGLFIVYTSDSVTKIVSVKFIQQT